jgi:hypothetical protein
MKTHSEKFVLPKIICIALLFSAVSSFAQERRKVDVPREIAEQLMSNDEDIKEMVKDKNYTADKLAGELSAETIDLNDDGKSELIVQGLCAPVGNCATWIYRKTGSGYQKLLEAEAQVVRLRRTVTNGYHDVAFEVHGSAYQSGIMIYKFDGKQYQLKECFDRDYSARDKRGRFYTRKRPTITRMKCESEQ